MTDDSSRWIWIPHWEASDEHPGFQHYRDRDPVWIKNYRWLLADDDYLDLDFSQRGILHGLWLATARAGNGRLPYKAVAIARHLGVNGSFRLRQLDPLIHAGFIDIRASKGLATRYQRASPEVEVEKERKKKRASGDEEYLAARAEKKRRMAEIPLPEGFQLAKGIHE